MPAPLVFLISGSSSGFGAELCLEALKRGHKVVGGARKPDAADNEYLQRIKAAGGVCTRLDVTDQKSCEEAVAFAQKTYGTIDVLVNNAGMAALGAFEDFPDKDLRRLFEVNVFGAMNLTRAALPVMRPAKGPNRNIVNISSIAGSQSGPGNCLYASSKHALEGWSEGLHHELQPFGIRVFTVGPGGFRTRILQDSSCMECEHSEPYKGSHPVAARVKLFHSFRDGFPGDPAIAAQRMIDEIEDPSMITVNTPDGKQVQRPVARLLVGDDAVAHFERAADMFAKNLQATRERSSNTAFRT